MGSHIMVFHGHALLLSRVMVHPARGPRLIVDKYSLSRVRVTNYRAGNQIDFVLHRVRCSFAPALRLRYST